MRFELGQLIGDPHLGRKFDVGVPAHRRGERESLQLTKFKDALAEPGDMVVMVGDLFENPYVSHAVVKQAIDAVLEAASARPETTFVMMAGNHDVPRKITATGAFDVFERAMDQRVPNVHVLREPALILGAVFFPWQWDVSAVDQVQLLRSALSEHPYEAPAAAIGHWDLASYGDDESHLAPTAALRNAFGDIPIYSGHYHTPGIYEVDGVEVQCTGSLEPYSHGEDPEGLIYVTMTRDEVLATDPETLRYKCVRVILAPGEERPKLDAFAVTGLPAAAVQQDAEIKLTLGAFDWSGIVKKALDPLDPEVRGFIQERLPSYEHERAGSPTD